MDRDTNFRLTLYREFVRHGRAPTSEELAGLVGVPVEEARAAMERLAAGRAIVLQPESRELLMAAPLSAAPTQFLVQLDDGRSCFAPCAWDALGIIAMLALAGNVVTSCSCCGEAIGLRVNAAFPLPAAAVVHFALPARQWWADVVFT